MTPRVKLFFWEQGRQSIWMLFAIANGLVACLVGEASMRLFHDYYMKEKDAVEMVDFYQMVSFLVIIFGSLVSQDRASDFTIGVPVRWLRLPMDTRRMAASWTAARMSLGLSAIILVTLLRQPFIHGQTELAPAQTIAYYGGGLLLMHGVVRLFAAWTEGAAWVATVSLTALLGAGGGQLWGVAGDHPATVLWVCAAFGVPACSLGIALRRRGGIIVNAPAVFGARRTAYTSVAEIPRFADGVAAQTWFESRRAGRVYPVLCTIGCFVALGAAALTTRNGLETETEIERLAHLFQVRHVGEALGMLLTVPLWCAFLTATWVAALDAFYANRPQNRFVRVHPLSGWDFSVARHRMLRASAGVGVLIVVVFGIVTVYHGAVNQVAYQPGGTHEFVSTVASALFEPRYSPVLGTTEPGQVSDLFLGVLAYVAVLAALFSVGNRYTAVVVLVLVIGLILADAMPTDPWGIGLLFVAPFVLVGVVLYRAVRAGLLGVRSAAWSVTGWLAVLFFFGVVGVGNVVSSGLNALLFTLPMGLILAVAVVSPMTAALIFHTRRSGSWFAPRLSAAGWHWGELRGFARGALVCGAIAIAICFTWRAVVAQLYREDLRYARSWGVAPGSPGLSEAERTYDLSDADLSSIATRDKFKLGISPTTRTIELISADSKRSTPERGAPVDWRQPFDAETSALLDELRPSLEPTVQAVERLIASAPATKPVAPIEFTREQFSDDYAYVHALRNRKAFQLSAFRAALGRCHVLAIQAANVNDRDMAYAALHAAGELVRAIASTNWPSTRFNPTVKLEDDPEAHLLVLEYALGKVAFTTEQCAAMRAVLPTPRSVAYARALFRAPMPEEFKHWKGWYDGYYGNYRYNGRWYIANSSDLVLTCVGEVLRVPDMYYAQVLHTAANLASDHDNCLNKEVHWSNYRRSYVYRNNFGSEDAADLETQHASIHLADGAVSLARQVLAVEEYRARHGAYPESLEQTVPEILPSLPVDWTRMGQKRACGYLRAVPTGCQVWIAGANGSDDHGVDGLDRVVPLSRQ